jgi:hypothetical protein
LLPEEIVRDLGLRVELRRRAVASYTPRPDGSGLLVRTGEAPHDGWREFYAMTARVGRAVYPTLTQPLPSRAQLRAAIGEDGAWEALFERPLAEVLERHFPDDLERGVALTDGLIGTFASADERSLRQNRCFLYHVIGNGTGHWDVPVGGMGALTGALADAAADDPDVDRAYEELVTSFVDVTAEHIEHEIAAGRILPLDARETATALVWMNERYLTLSLGREPAADRAVVAQTLHTIWSRVLYGAR